MIGKAAFIASHEIIFPGFLSTYNGIMKHQYASMKERVEEQNGRLRTAIRYAYDSVPYYHRLFDELKLKPDDIRDRNSLRKLPILTREDIRYNWETLKPIGLEHVRFTELATGGTTGTPLMYRQSKRDRMIGGAILYRGWNYAGYRLGDRMVYLAGSSLGVPKKGESHLNTKEFVRNARMLSSFSMGEKELRQYVSVINAFRPKFIRGYPSSLDLLSRWANENRASIHRPEGVFVTSERLFPHMRRNIESTFGCDVFNHYGLNDGGVSAFECGEHSGLHVDTERSLMEVVDEHGDYVEEGEGRIIATSLNNDAMPFVRYDTGDIALMTRDRCKCGRDTDLIEDVVGRTTDIIRTPDGRAIHGWFFLYIFWEHGRGIRQYQVVQESLTDIVVNIVPDHDFDETVLEQVRRICREQCASWKIEFRIVDHVTTTKGGKTKFIVSKLVENLQ